MMQVQFQRNVGEVFAQADATEVRIGCGWTVPVPRSQAVKYVKTYNSEPNLGFYENGNEVVLTHNLGKIVFSKPEAAALIQLIKSAFPEAI